ncbi:MAG TPA: ribulose-phosphate 3-epimerase, partial [Solirubrobacteraceae bacterium]|nr:ribulose-phosphate 3-epimerase [Solirubrobacteraceae bacterium]
PRVRALVGADVAVEVDGGIEPLTAPSCLEAGANVFVAGSAIFSAPDPGESYRAIAASVDAADPVTD